MPGAIVRALQSVPDLRLQPVSFEPSPDPADPHMPMGVGGADIPQGYMSFCLRFADQCATPVADAPTTILLTPAVWRKLNEVNSAINSSIWPASSNRHYGRVVYWNIPTDGYGDCEDFALVKRKDLVAAGMPQAALRLAVVITRRSERCVVLTVVTDQGDFVLDDQHDEIQLWNATDYAWIERQDPTRQYGWVWLNSTATDERLFAMRNAPPATALVAPPPVQPAPSQPVALALNLQLGPSAAMPPSKPPMPAAAVTSEPKSTVKKSNSNGEQTIQLGAWRNQEHAVAARNYWMGTGSTLLGGLLPQLVPFDLPGKGRYYRLRAGGVPAGNALSLCATLRAQNLNCLVVKN